MAGGTAKAMARGLALLSCLRLTSSVWNYQCSQSGEGCTNNMLGLLGMCAAASKTPSTAACPTWVQIELDNACSSCTQPTCASRQYSAEQFNFFQGARPLTQGGAVIDWTSELETCGGRYTKCSLAKCSTQWMLIERYTDSTCSTNPYEIIYRKATRNALLMKVDQPCTPLNCQKKTYFNKITYYESRICTNQLFSNPSQLTSLLTPDATYLTTFYFSETATSCGVNNLNAIHLVGQSQCIPYMDIFTDALPSSEDYLSYTCSTRALSHCRDSTCSNCYSNQTFSSTSQQCIQMNQNMTKLAIQSNAQLCTSLIIQDFYSDSTCTNVIQQHLIAGAAITSACKPQSCLPLDTSNTSQGTNYMSVYCLTNFPSPPSPIPGKLMEYKVKTTWYNPTCSGRPVEILYTLDNMCVWNTDTNDNTYLRVDTKQQKTYYYSYGDHKCQNSVSSQSWASELQTSQQCSASIQCGMTQTPQFFDPNSNVDMSTCLSSFTTVSILVNAACTNGSDPLALILVVLFGLLPLTFTMF